jgi:CheY-like chemotaxis protein
MSTVLVVDDMPIFRDPLAASLRLAGYDTLCAADGAAALALARVRRPDVILLDVSMPVMDGFACLRDLRRDPKLADVPVILLTAASDRRFVLEAGKLGVKDYLLKSRFSLADLMARVGKYAEPRPAAARKTGTG